MDLLALAKAERARLDKVIALLEADAAATPSSSAKPKTKTKGNAATKAYWTPARRKAMSNKIKSLQAKKAGKAPPQPKPQATKKP